MIERLNTKQILFDSLCDLCKMMPMEKIKVNDIVQNCGYKRGTFYYYFKDKEDLIITMMYENTQKIHEQYYGSKNWEFIMLKNLEFCYLHKDLMSDLGKITTRFSNELHTFMFEYVNNIAKKFYRTDSLSYKLEGEIRFYCAGATSIYGNWIMNGFKENANTVANLIANCIPVDLQPILNNINESR